MSCITVLEGKGPHAVHLFLLLLLYLLVNCSGAAGHHPTVSSIISLCQQCHVGTSCFPQTATGIAHYRMFSSTFLSSSHVSLWEGVEPVNHCQNMRLLLSKLCVSLL